MDVTLLLNTSQRSTCLQKNESGGRSITLHEADNLPSMPYLRGSYQAGALEDVAEPRRRRGRLSDDHFVPRSVNTSLPADSFTHRQSFCEQKDATPLYEISGGADIFARNQITTVNGKHLFHDVVLSLPSLVQVYAENSASPTGSTKSENDISIELSRRDYGRLRKTHTAEHEDYARGTAMPSSHRSPMTGFGVGGLKLSERLESLSRQHSSLPSPKSDAAARGTGQLTCDRAPIGHISGNGPSSAAAGGSPLSDSSRRFARPKMHKRATSAPDFAISSSIPQPDMAHTRNTRVPVADSGLEQGHGLVGASPDSSLSSLTPEPRSRPHSESPLPAGHPISTIQSAQGRDGEISLGQVEMQDGLWEEPCCMFVKDCNTGSQLRKAISHLFGRNKSCTLRIPKKVWVYYCRKHYQRVRYRNAKTYPLNQMELVRLQIRRLQSWSVENQRSGSGPYIKNWTLSLRKREQNRLDQSVGADNADDGENQTGPPAPEWLLQRLGSGYSTEQMMDIAQRLHDEIKDATLGQVPEIEFLPDIVDPEEGVPSRPGRIRKQSRPPSDYRPLKRKASSKLSDLRPNTQATSPFWPHRDLAVDLSEKRARTDTVGHPYRQESAAPPESHSTSSGPTYPDGFHASPPMLPGVEHFDHRQGGHGMFVHPHAEGLNGAYDQEQPTSAYRQFGPESPQAGLRWTSPRDGGHIRLPSINSQLPLQEPEYSISPARPFLRQSGTLPNEQERSRYMHHQRSNSTTFPPYIRSDHSSTWSSGSRPDPKIVSSPVFDYEPPNTPREPWQQRERGFAPTWEGGYHRGPNAVPPAPAPPAPPAQHPLFQNGLRREEHSPSHLTYSWQTHPADRGDDASYAPAGWQQEPQMSDKAKRCSFPPPLQ